MVYKWYILPIGRLYGTYHLLREPETTIESVLGKKHQVFLVGCPAAPLLSKACWKNSSRRSLLRRKSWSSQEISPYRSWGLVGFQGMGLFVCFFFCWVKSRLLLDENIIITKIYLLSFHGLKQSNSWWFMPCPTCFDFRRAILLRSASSTSHWQLDIINRFSLINLSTPQCLWDSVFFTSSPDPSRRPERGCVFFFSVLGVFFRSEILNKTWWPEWPTRMRGNAGNESILSPDGMIWYVSLLFNVTYIDFVWFCRPGAFAKVVFFGGLRSHFYDLLCWKLAASPSQGFLGEDDLGFLEFMTLLLEKWAEYGSSAYLQAQAAVFLWIFSKSKSGGKIGLGPGWVHTTTMDEKPPMNLWTKFQW